MAQGPWFIAISKGLLQNMHRILKKSFGTEFDQRNLTVGTKPSL